MLLKFGESIQINQIEDSSLSIAKVDQNILNNFVKLATSLKKIAPKADDFLYFSAIMMHAAEAAAINEDGSPKLTKSGEPVKVEWVQKNGSWKWKSNDPNILPYKNSNRDIFPEQQLIEAHKRWIGKPLCIDHQSSSVDHVRGFIVDTFYDAKLKRVIALCALDKKNYPDLARKVETGYSNNVSMGTAVETAICSDCGKVAKAEHEFCSHMKSKSCYGEINVGLNPIELSIVVNGADPRAKIKHIVAAAQNLDGDITKIAEKIYSLNINENDLDGGTNKSTNIAISTPNLQDLRKCFEEAVSKLESVTDDIKSANEEITEDVGEKTASNVDSINFAAENNSDLLKKVASFTNTLQERLVKLSKDLSKLSNEEIMSGDKLNKQSYFQGTVDPTPGKPTYEKDPLNEDLRDDTTGKGDKHMAVDDTGPVEGLFPGDLEKKKMLARAQAEERAMRRNAALELAKKAVDRKAYFQGGGGVNEPEQGGTKYKPDPMNEKLRSQDKHMVGHKPFPDVGKVDELYPGFDGKELKEKQRLQRASLKAKFVKASNKDGSQDFGKSAWEVYSNGKLVVRASVDDITNGKPLALYDTVATKEFGTKLLEKIKIYGADTVTYLYKRAAGEAPAEAAPAPAEGAPAPAEGTPAAEAAPAEGDKNTQILEDVKAKLSDVMEMLKDVKSADEALKEAAPPAAGGGEAGAAAGGIEALMGGGAAAPAPTTASLNQMGKQLNGALQIAMKEAKAELENHEKELNTIIEVFDRNAVNKENKNFVSTLVEDALKDATASMNDTKQLFGAFVKYARGTEALVKRAAAEAKMVKKADHKEEKGWDSVIAELMGEPSMDKPSMDEHPLDSGDLDVSDLDTSDLDAAELDVSDLDTAALDLEKDSAGNYMPPKEVATMPDKDRESAIAALKKPTASTKAQRAAIRAKLAADSIQMSEMIDEAHPKADGDIELDVKVSDDLDVVEGLEGVHDAMMDVATTPVKVRKEAEAIQRLVAQGKLAKEDVEDLVKEGVDKAAVDYWKKYFSVDSESKEFATDMLKEHYQAKMAAELEAHKVKLARAYELTYDMVDRGLCHKDRTAIASQVEEILKLDDAGFDSMKRVVAKNSVASIRKAASGVMPQVGILGNVNAVVEEEDLVNQLSAAFATSKKRNF